MNTTSRHQKELELARCLRRHAESLLCGAPTNTENFLNSAATTIEELVAALSVDKDGGAVGLRENGEVCPACGEGKLSLHWSIHKGSPLFYSVCDVCKSELANNEQSVVNIRVKGAILDTHPSPPNQPQDVNEEQLLTELGRYANSIGVNTVDAYRIKAKLELLGYSIAPPNQQVSDAYERAASITWQGLMDYCYNRKVSPAEHNDLFLLVDAIRALIPSEPAIGEQK